jgi:hypothetical protein
MSVLLVAYDLGKTGTNYPELLEKINRYSNIRITESSYAIIADKSPEAICTELQKHVGDENALYVITLNRPYASSKWNFASDWLYKELSFLQRTQ